MTPALLSVAAAMRLLAHGDFAGAERELERKSIAEPAVAEARALVARLRGDEKAAFEAWKAHVAARPERACDVARSLLGAGDLVPAHAIGCPEVARCGMEILHDWLASPLWGPAHEARLRRWRDATGVIVAVPSTRSARREICEPELEPFEAALSQGRAGLAEQEAVRLVHERPDRKVSRHVAEVFFRWGRPRTALVFARRAIAFGVERSFLSRAFLAAGLPEEALRGAPDVETRVRALRALGRVDEAREAAGAEMLARPLDAAPHVAFARAVADEDPRRARTLLARARALDPTSAAAAIALADLFGAREAEPVLRALAVARPGDPEVAGRLAGAYRDAGAVSEARRFACVAGLRPESLDLTPTWEQGGVPRGELRELPRTPPP